MSTGSTQKILCSGIGLLKFLRAACSSNEGLKGIKRQRALIFGGMRLEAALAFGTFVSKGLGFRVGAESHGLFSRRTALNAWQSLISSTDLKKHA